jgi:hypothetical protein
LAGVGELNPEASVPKQKPGTANNLHKRRSYLSITPTISRNILLRLLVATANIVYYNTQ